MHLHLSIKILAVPVALCCWALSGCRPALSPPPAAPVPPPPPPNHAPLGAVPRWGVLEGYQESIAASEFGRVLQTTYALPMAWSTTLQWDAQRLLIRRETAVDSGETMALRFGNRPATAPRYWRTRAELPARPDPEKPLQGVKIALDPGHIGGEWAVLEERSFDPGGGPPVREGDLTLQVAKLLQPMLEEMGATVNLVRQRPAPVTPLRARDLYPQARDELRAMGIDPENPPDSSPVNTVHWRANRLFYRTAEIRARAQLVNQSLRPDLVICIHFNASSASWGPPGQPVFSSENHLHLLRRGAYSRDELQLDDQRQEMLLALLSGVQEEEIALGTAVAPALATATGLPPFTYHGGAMATPGQPYLWARNLLANRLYQCPVIYLEPYIMNHRETCRRLQAGDYEGTQEIEGRVVGSIFREYAGGVAAGMREYFSR